MYERPWFDREQRVVVRCRVEFHRLDEPIVAESEDLSKTGVFVRTNALLPVGSVVELALSLPSETFRVIARVAHIMAPSAARALGRRTGMGFEFLEQNNEGRLALTEYLDDLIEEFTPPPQELPHAFSVVVADPHPPFLDRVSRVLKDTGFEVLTAATGAEAYTLCSERQPEALLASVTLPVVDGWKLVEMLSQKPRLASMSVMLMSEDGSDLERLRAFRMGASDFVHKPFTDEELLIRLHRLAMAKPREQDATLRGNLSEISVATLLSLLEFERKSGILVFLRDAGAARLFVSEGQIVKVEGPHEGGTPLERMMSVLDWNNGSFEFSRCEVVGADELGLRTQSLLLEHARTRDEASER